MDQRPSAADVCSWHVCKQRELHHWQSRSQGPAPAAWTRRSCDINSAGQWSVFCCLDIVEQIGQPCLESCLIGKSARCMHFHRSYHNGSTYCLTFYKLNPGLIFSHNIHMLLILCVYSRCCSYTAVVAYSMLFWIQYQQARNCKWKTKMVFLSLVLFWQTEAELSPVQMHTEFI